MSVLRIAHRGGAALLPENTLEAFSDAMARGLDGAELDVQLTRDGEVIVFHDFSLKPDLCRDSAGAWIAPPGSRIADAKLSEIRGIDVGRPRPGSRYALTHPLLQPRDGARIPLLAEVIALARERPKPFRLFVELKSPIEAESAAGAEMLAERTFDIVARGGYLDHAIFVGFDWRALRRIKTLDTDARCWFTTLPQSWFWDGVPPRGDDPPPEPALWQLRQWAATATSPWAAGFDAVRFNGSICEAVRAAGADGWFPFHRDADEAEIAEAHRLGLVVGAWTVNDRARMDALAAFGIDAICTDRTDLIMDI